MGGGREGGRKGGREGGLPYPLGIVVRHVLLAGA